MNPKHSIQKYALLATLGFLFYVLIANLGLQFATINKSASPLWPASGFAVIFLFVFGIRYLPSIFLGAFTANYLTGMDISADLIIAVGNSGEAFVVTYLLRKFYPQITFLESPPVLFHKELLRLIVTAFAGSSVSAVCGTFALFTVGVVNSHTWANTFITWFTGDVLGIYVFSPILYFLFKFSPNPKISTAHLVEGTKNLAGILVSLTCAWFIFFTPNGSSFLYILLPVLLFNYLLCGRLGLFSSSFLIALMSVHGTALGWGPFSWGSINENIIALQVFSISLATTALAINCFSHYAKNTHVVIILMATWFVSGSIFYSLDRAKKQADLSHDIHSQEAIVTAIKDRLATYEDALHGTAGLFVSSEYVDAQEFKEYVSTLKITERYPGIRGIGFIEKIPKALEQRYKVEVRKEIESFTLHPVPSSEMNEVLKDNSKYFHVIKYIEPIQDNGPAQGLITSSEEKRRIAADTALETKKPQMTADINLIQDASQKVGFLFYIPIFKKEKFIGWVYAPILFADLVHGSLGNVNLDLNFKISSQEKNAETKDLFSHGNFNQKNTFEKTFQLYNRAFTATFQRNDKYISAKNFSVAWVGTIGALLALMTAWMYVNTLIYRDNAEATIQKRTHELINSAKMASLGQMASGMAHEINNPLAIISGKAQVLKARLQTLNLLSPQILNDLNKIETTTYRISKIIKGLKAFSRDSAKDPMIAVSIKEMIDDTMELCQERFKNYLVEVHMDCRTSAYVDCRPSQISQVILNVLNNAFDAIHTQEKKVIEILAIDNGHVTTIEIRDNGPGIPSEVAPKILEPFFSTKGVNEGTGLGLSISKGIIEAHEGNLSFERDQLRGMTCFRISLPMSKDFYKAKIA